MGACNLHVHMTSQARNSLVLQGRLLRAYVNSGRISRATLHPSVYRLVFPCIIIWCTRTCVCSSQSGSAEVERVLRREVKRFHILKEYVRFVLTVTLAYCHNTLMFQ